MLYFPDCYTADELKDRYRKLAKQLHPDMGGSKEEFQAMVAEYERVLPVMESQPPLPELFELGREYRYMHQYPAVYIGCDSYWYKFDRPKGGYVWVNANQLHLIREVVGVKGFI